MVTCRKPPPRRALSLQTAVQSLGTRLRARRAEVALRQLGLGSRYMGPGPRLDYHYDFFVVRESIEIFRGLRAQWSDGGQL